MRRSSFGVRVLAAAWTSVLVLATTSRAAVLSTSAVTLRAADTYIVCHATNVGSKPIEVEIEHLDSAGNATGFPPLPVDPGQTFSVSFQPVLKPNPFRCRFTFQGGKSKIRGNVENVENVETGATSEAR